MSEAGFFAALDALAFPLMDAFGSPVEYIRAAGGSVPIRAIVDASPSITDANGAGGARFQTGKALASFPMDSIPNPKKGDVIRETVGRFAGRRWKINDPYDGGGGMWDASATEVIDDR